MTPTSRRALTLSAIVAGVALALLILAAMEAGR